MGTIMSIRLLFTQSSRICRANVGSHAVVFKSLRFGPFTLKHNPGVFKLKQGLKRFQKSQFWSIYTETQPASIAKVMRFKTKSTSVNGA